MMAPLTSTLDLSLEALLAAPVYGLPQTEKSALLMARLNALSEWHRQHCPAFSRITRSCKTVTPSGARYKGKGGWRFC